MHACFPDPLVVLRKWSAKARLIFLPAGCSAALVSSSAVAADPAQTLFDFGIERMEAGQYDQACPAIERSYYLDPRPGTLFTLAECEAKRGRIATAVAHYDDYLVLVNALPPAKKKAQEERMEISKRQKRKLEPLIPTIVIIVPGNLPPGTVVEFREAPLQDSSFGKRIAVDPGEYTVTIRLPGSTPKDTSITVDKGAHKEVVLDVGPQQSVTLPTEKGPIEAAQTIRSGGVPAPRAATTRTVPYAIGALGLLGLSVGAGTLIGAAVTEDDDKRPPLIVMSVIGFAVGVAGTTTAVILLSEPAAQTKAFQHRHWSIGAAPCARSGGLLSVQGSW